MTAYQWQITVNIDDATAVTIGRTVAPSGDLATDDECRRYFAMALPQFMARAVAARYAQALADRATAHANDLASAAVTVYPEGYDPTQFVAVPTEPGDPPGPPVEFAQGPAADPAFRIGDLTADAPFASMGELASAADRASSG